MKFQSLHLSNWKNFASVQVSFQDRLFLVGPNASGKSNFLDALRFLRDLAETGGGLQESVRRRGGIKAIRSLAARQETDIEIRVAVSDGPDAPLWEYTLAWNQDVQRRTVVTKECVTSSGRKILDRPNEEDRADRARLTQTYLEQVNANRDFRGLATFFASLRYLHIVPQLVREPDRSAGRTNDPFGGDFLEQIARTPQKTRRSRLRRIQEALRVAVPQLREIELWRDARGTPHLRGKYEHWRPQGAWQTEEQFSDGTLRLLGLLWVAMEGGGPLLLEEPELSLHPEIVRYLPSMFLRLQRRTGRQIFISTHSPELLRDEGIGLDEVVLLIPGREGTEVKPLASLQEAHDLLKGGLPLPDIVMPQTRPENARQLTLFED